MENITKHPILQIPIRKKIKFKFDGNELTGFEGMVISSALFLNKIKIALYDLLDCENDIAFMKASTDLKVDHTRTPKHMKVVQK